MATAIPLCIPDICSWNESSQQYIRHKQRRTERDSLIVVEAARRRLRAINGPVCVVTIAGPCRKGKSFILSKAFDQGEVFPLGHLLDPETMGIWMWVVPQKFTDKNGREFTVVLLDSEGINAVTAENKDDHKIFTLSVLLASVLIYNSSGVPNRTDLEGLDYISQLSQRIHLRATNQNERGEKRPNFNKTFPYFLWLLRDVLLDLPSDCSTIKDYFLKRVFNSELDSNDKAGDVAESILDLFQGFDAFALPMPSYDSNAVKHLNDHNVQNQLNPEFISRVQEFSTFLRSKLCPKTSFNDGEYVTGEALASLVDIYVETLNTPGAVPNVQKAWEVFIQSKCSESSIAALKVYEETMSSVQEAIPCTNDEVYRYHSGAWDRCLNLFKCETDCISAVTADRYLKDLTAETDKMFKHWMETNRRTTKDTCEQLLSQLKKSILDPVLIKLTSGEASSLTFEDIVQTYNSIESKFKTQALGAEDVCASVFANFQPHLNAEMQKHVKYLQQLKNYDANIAKEREERAKEEEQRKLFEEQVKMLEQRKRQVEKECKIMAEKKEKDEERLREQHQQQLRAQEEQHRNMMEAHMDKLRREREAMEAQRDNTGDIIKMMGDMMKSRDQELTQLTQAVMEIANRPPTVIEKDSGGGFLSILPEAIKAIGSIFVKK